MSPNVQTISPISVSSRRETKRGPSSYPEADSTVDLAVTRDEEDLGLIAFLIDDPLPGVEERWLAGESVEEIFGVVQAHRRVDEIEGGALTGGEAGAPETRAEGSGLREFLLLLETLPTWSKLVILPAMSPELQRTSARAPNDGATSDNRSTSTGEKGNPGKRNFTEQSNSGFQGGGKKGKKDFQKRGKRKNQRRDEGEQRKTDLSGLKRRNGY